MSGCGRVHKSDRSRQHGYELAPERVLYEQKPDGGFSLKIRARGFPVVVTIEIDGGGVDDHAT
jgi:hypothetical protein